MIVRGAMLCWVLLGYGTAVDSEPEGSCQLTLRPAREAAVFDVTEEAQVKATIRNVAGRDLAVALEYEVYDAEGLRRLGGTVSAAVPTGEIRGVDLRLGTSAQLPTGEHLTVRVRLLCGGRCEAECRKGFGFLPRREAVGPPEQSPFGLLAEHHWPLLQRLGVRHVRPNWSWAERPMEWASRYRIAHLADVRFKRRWDAGQDVYALEFARGPRAVLALWGERPGGAAEIQHPPGDVLVTSPSGRQVRQSGATGITIVELTGGPRLYQLPGAVTELKSP